MKVKCCAPNCFNIAIKDKTHTIKYDTKNKGVQAVFVCDEHKGGDISKLEKVLTKLT